MTGKELRKLRTDAGLSQAELADLLDVARETVCRWERGKLAISRLVGRGISFTMDIHALLESVRNET